MISLAVSHGIQVAAALRPHKIAVIDRGRCLTFSALLDRCVRVANVSIHGLRLAPGTRVGLLAPNCLEYIEIVLGLSMGRTPAVLLNSRLPAAELAQICDDCRIGALFVHPALRGLVEEFALTQSVEVIELGSDYEGWLGRASGVMPQDQTQGEDIFCIALTGGTTGRSKGVLLSQRSRVLMYLNMGVVFGCYGHEERNLTVCPLFHGSGFNFCFATLFFGGTVVIVNKFEPELVIDRIAAEKITNASVVPTHLAAMFGLGERRVRAAETSSLRALISNGAPLALSMKQMGSGIWDGRVLSEAYGGTEAGVISTISPSRLLQRPSSVGEIFPGSFAELRDDDGNPVLQGETGELYTSSPYLFSGYEGDAVGGIQSGWFSAGDLGKFDEDGFLYLLDRKEEKIISGGVNIYPSEVELALADHPAVADVAVFGVADAYWGESVHALVSVVGSSGVSVDELLDFARGRVGRLKAPKTLEIRSALPKSAAGKVLRRVLRDEYRARAVATVGSGPKPVSETAGASDVD